MSEDTNTAHEQDTTATERDDTSKDTGRTFTQDEVNRLLAKERRDQEARFAGYDELKAKAAKFDEAEEANKSELDKALARADKAEAELEAARLDALRSRVAAAKNLPAELAGRLTGTTEEELEADADNLAEALRPARTPDTAQGAVGDTPASGVSFITRSHAPDPRRLRPAPGDVDIAPPLRRLQHNKAPIFDTARFKTAPLRQRVANARHPEKSL